MNQATPRRTSSFSMLPVLLWCRRWLYFLQQSEQREERTESFNGSTREKF